MKRTLLTLLAAASLSAQTPAIQFLPSGTWMLCQSGIAPAFYCALDRFPATYEPFMLLVTAVAPDTTGFEYDIKGSLKDGTMRHFRGVFSRNDAVNGGQSGVIIDAGLLNTITITVRELPSGAIQTLER